MPKTEIRHVTKRRVKASTAGKGHKKRPTPPPPAKRPVVLDGVRFSARSIRAQRKRLKLSLDAYSRLLGVTLLTVYKWESGQSRPTKERLAALLVTREMKPEEAQAKLDAMRTKANKASRRKGRMLWRKRLR